MPDIDFIEEPAIDFQELSPAALPPKSPEELAARRLDLMKSTGAKLEGQSGPGLVEMATTPLARLAKPVSRQQFADAMDILALAGAQAEGVIGPDEAKEVAAEPSRRPKEWESFLAGAQQATSEAVNFFTSPLGVATLGTAGAPAAIQKTVAGAFVVDMARQYPLMLRELSSGIRERDSEKVGRSLTGLGLNTVFIKKGLESVFSGKAIDPALPKAEESKPAEPKSVESKAKEEIDFEPEPAQDALAGPSGHPFPTELPERPGSPETPVRASEIIKDMAEVMDRPIRIGHIGGSSSKVAGIFKSPAEVARIRVANDIPVAAHEMAHGLERVHRRALGDVSRNRWVAAMPPDVRAELKGLDYDPSKGRVYEGFAEFVRHWLTLGDTTAVAPRSHAWFESTFLSHNPEVRAGMEGVRAKVQTFQQQGAVKRVESMIAFEEPAKTATLGERATELKEKGIRLFVDDLRSLEQVEREMSGGQLATGTSSPTKMARTVTQASGARAREWANHGMTDFAGNKVGPSLKEIFARDGIKGKEKDAMLFAVANRAAELHGRGINPGIELADARFTLDKLRTPEREAFAAEIRAWNEGALKYLADAGGISPDTVTRITALNQAYIPFFRVFEQSQGLGGGGRRIGDTPKPVKSIKGSGREIKNPIESMIEHANQVISVADKTRVARALVDLANNGRGFGKWVENIPPDKVPTQFHIDRVRQQLRDAGVAVPEEVDAVLTVWQNAPRNPKGANIVSFVQNGKPSYFELHPDLYRALQALDYQKIHPLLDTLFGKPARAVRLGATGIRAGFTLITNPIRDFATLMLQTKGNPLRAASQWGKHVAKQLGLKDGEIKEIWRATGGEIAQPLGLDRRSMQTAIDDVMANSAQRVALNVLKHPVETIRRVLSFTEAAPRLAEFEMTLREMGWKPGTPVTPDMAVEAAIRAAEVTVNFKRAGSWGRMVNQITAFFNPAVQGFSKFTRSHQEHPMRSVARGLGFVTFPAIANWWMNKDDPEWKRLPAWVKYGFLNFKIMDEWVRIPTPFEWWYAYGAVPIATMEAIYEKQPLRLKLAFQQIIEAIAPPVIPSAVQPVLEVGANESFFTERPIVPEAQKRLLPQEQALPNTSATARQVAQILSVGGVEVSPIQLEHLLNGWSGGLWRDIIATSERMAGVSPERENLEPADFPIAGRLFIRDNASAVIDEFYTELEQVRSKQATWKKLTKEGSARADKYELTPSEIQLLSSGNKVENVLTQLRQAYRDAKTREERQEIFNRMEELAGMALGTDERPANPASR